MKCLASLSTPTLNALNGSKIMRKIPTKFEFVKIYKHEDEYIVKVPSNPDADYFTGDWQDALGTAELMEAALRAKTTSCEAAP